MVSKRLAKVRKARLTSPREARFNLHTSVAGKVANTNTSISHELRHRHQHASSRRRCNLCNVSEKRSVFVHLSTSQVCRTYTVILLIQRPSPIPQSALPTRNMASLLAHPSKAAPIANTNAPAATIASLPKRSASCPAKKEGKAPVSMISETVNPRRKGVSSPMLDVKYGISVTAPMLPVS